MMKNQKVFPKVVCDSSKEGDFEQIKNNHQQIPFVTGIKRRKQMEVCLDFFQKLYSLKIWVFFFIAFSPSRRFF